MRGVLLAFLALAFNQNAQAHVHYGDITNIGAAGIYDQFVPFGWAQGQIQPGTNVPQGALATTDDVNWYSFTLTQTSEITLSITSSDQAGPGTQLTAPAFSLYKGLFVDQSFDVNPLIPLGSNRGLVNTAASFTLTTDSLSLAQAQANERTINYITSATDGGTGTAELVNYLLGPGSYSVIAGGNSPYDLAVDQSGLQLGAIIAFTSTPVPVPAAFWLMSTFLAGLGLFGKRKNRLVA